MKLAAISLLTVVAASSGCATYQTPLPAFVYGDVQAPGMVTTNTARTKTGRACGQNYLGIVATGDASIETARKTAGIEKIATVDHDGKSILGVYAEYCTVVYGE